MRARAKGAAVLRVGGERRPLAARAHDVYISSNTAHLWITTHKDWMGFVGGEEDSGAMPSTLNVPLSAARRFPRFKGVIVSPSPRDGPLGSVAARAENTVTH